VSDRPDVERIRAPAVPPPEVPDDLAAQEERDAGAIADMTPAKRNIILYERAISSLEKQCALFNKEKAQIHETHTDNLKRLDTLVSSHAALEQAYRDARATNGLAALAMLLGWAAISAAGAISEANWKLGLFWGGVAFFAAGFVFAVQTHFRNSPKNYRADRD